MRSMMLGNENTTIVNLFTASQWQELEQQALIYKYMASGVPVPHDLILSVRRSLYNSSLSNQPTSFGGVWDGGFPYNHHHHHHHHQLVGVAGGYGRKIDLEPGRCRRTDGKKWRCSKEAYLDSKYCERHMHRGRNRSRKPVESSSSSTSTLLNHHHASSSSSPSTTISHSHHHAYPPPLSSNIHTTFIDSFSYSHPHETLKDNIYRPHLQGMKDLGDQGQRSAYFQLTDPYTNTQKMSSSNHHQNYSHFSFQNLKDEQKKEQEQEHCYVMGTDFIKPSEELTTTTQKADHETSCSKQPFHHFFAQPNTSTLNPPNPDPNWDQQQQLINSSKVPLSTQDLFQSKPRPYW